MLTCDMAKWLAKMGLQILAKSSPKCNILLYNRDYKGGLLNESDFDCGR